MPPVGLAADAFAEETGSLRVRDRPLVEAVDLELEPVVAEVLEQVPLELPRRLVGDVPAAEVRMDGEATEPGDPASAVLDLEAHDAGALPVDLDEEPAEGQRLPPRALDLR